MLYDGKNCILTLMDINGDELASLTHTERQYSSSYQGDWGRLPNSKKTPFTGHHVVIYNREGSQRSDIHNLQLHLVKTYL